MTEIDMRFAGSGGINLAGTLARPDMVQKPQWGAVLVAGSGPTDRDGNQTGLKTDLLRQIASALANVGVASLRYDKRGIGQSDKPSAALPLSEFALWERFRDDVKQAADFLRGQGVADSGVILIGHSEGGLLCLQAAQTAHPAALVLLGTPGRPLATVIHEQVAALLKQQSATPAQTTYFLSENDRVSKAIVKTGRVPPDVPPGLAALYPGYLGSFLKSLLSADPALEAARVTVPTLIVQGVQDAQISAARDAPLLNRALRTPHELVLVPGASHNLKLGTDSLGGPVAPDALKAITDWIRKTRKPVKS